MLIKITDFNQFQSTLPYGSDLRGLFQAYASRLISIHAPLRERLKGYVDTIAFQNFNPRSLTGATFINCKTGLSLEFQSTLPYGSDACFYVRTSATIISIHAPLRERLSTLNVLMVFLTFQSTLPYGSDPHFQEYKVCNARFQSTLPYGSDYIKRFKEA